MPQPSTSPVALVTGAGRGIGRAVAQHLSAQGLRVVLTSRSADELAETAATCTSETLVVPADITASSSVDDVFSRVEREWGPVEVLVSNAGAATSAPLARTTDDQWQQMIDLNLTAPFRCLRRALPSMVDARHGRVVVIASVAAKVGEPYIAAYTASKHGVLGLVRSAAAELATSGVTVNAVCPGYVDTPMTAASVAAISTRTGRSEVEARGTLERKQPTGRLITPNEVALAVWLCVTNGGINGQGINVDGGAVQS